MLVGTGLEQKSFTLHLDIISRHTDYFNVQDHEKVAYLTRVQPELFSQYLHCAYFNRVPDEVAGEAVVDSIYESEAADNRKPIDEPLEGNKAADMLLESLVELYELAAKLEDLITVNLVMDEFVRLSGILELCSLNDLVDLAYNWYWARLRRHACPLQKLLLDFCFFGHHEVILEDPRDVQQGMIDRLLEVTTEDRDARYETKTNLPDRLCGWSIAQQAQKNKCEYHLHQDSRDECK